MKNSRKSIFFTSDLHLFHQNSIAFDQRPFKDLKHMHEVIRNNYNATVPPNGVCYFLGDLGFGNQEALKEFITSLNGEKILLLGNHDKGMNSAYNLGFSAVLHNATLYIAGEEVTMSHCPLLGVFREDTAGMNNAKDGENWHGEHRHKMFSVENRGQFHLHGHIHSGPANNKDHHTLQQFDIGMPGNKFTPVSISTIESWIVKAKRGLC